MSEEDRKYLRSIRFRRPSFEIFEKMVKILAGIQEQTDKLLKTSLLEKI